MGILGKIFTWWDGATIGTSLFSALNGEAVGTDAPFDMGEMAPVDRVELRKVTVVKR